MKAKSKSIGSFEAKTHLSNLIDNVLKGNDYIITKRGKPVARLIPYTTVENQLSIKEIVIQFDNIRKSVKGNIKIKEYINEGRKY
ncbi:MAG TPA: type II toxin-antitoxin system prevent-host-death family antitoxin [Spirochaetota bacterium]|nr:type II toxin-antitoxin system prevent-host-death family antitoxin [Spirochaetota bacterium]HNT12769.1 type II toxin-antitoxin system prevent-host-death family antitoxin [Spirochaetota bacterium]